MLSCRSRPDGGVGLEKKKVTTYFLSLSTGFAANMPGLSAVKQDIPQFNRDRPGVVGLSPLNRSCGILPFTSHHLICHFSQHPRLRNTALGFSWLSKLSKYSFHLCFTFSSSISISSDILLITLTCCTFLLCLFLCFAILSNSFSPSFVSSFLYSSSYALFTVFATFLLACFLAV